MQITALETLKKKCRKRHKSGVSQKYSGDIGGGIKHKRLRGDIVGRIEEWKRQRRIVKISTKNRSWTVFFTYLLDQLVYGSKHAC
jgi:hypothetical protein